MFYVKSPLSLVMFLRIVAEMTTKNKSYGDYFPDDSIALFIAFSPNRNILLRCATVVPPYTPYSANSGWRSAYSKHCFKAGQLRHMAMAASVASVFLTPLKSWSGIFGSIWKNKRLASSTGISAHLAPSSRLSLLNSDIFIILQ